MVPIGDLFGKPILHRGFRLRDERQLAIANFLEMLGHDVGHRVALRLLLQFAGDPSTLGPSENGFDARLALGQWAVIEVGRVVHMARRAIGVELDIEHALRDDAAFARPGKAGVLDRMFEIEEHARPGAEVALVHQHGAALEQVTVALEREVDDRVEQRVARTDEGGEWLTLRSDQRLFEGYALIARQHRFADADQTVAIAHRRRNVGDLVAARLTLLGRSAETLEGCVEERLDVVGLEAAGLGALHVFADAVHPARVHGVVGERPFFQQIPELAAVERVLQHGREPGAHFRLVAVADRFDEQVA